MEFHKTEEPILMISLEELKLIRESLEYTIKAFEEYTKYPDYEFKQQKISEAKAVKNKISALIQEAKRNSKEDKHENRQ